MSTIAPQVRETTTAATRNVSVDFTGALDSSETLTGTPALQSSGALTTSGAQVNTSVIVINGVSVAIGKAVQFTVSAAAKGKYLIEIVVTTSGGQTLEGAVRLNVTTTRYQ